MSEDSGALRREDIDAGYPVFFAGFEAGANFILRRLAEDARSYIRDQPEILRMLAKTIFGEIGIDLDRPLPYVYEDIDGDNTYGAWRSVHPEDGASPELTIADDWYRKDLVVFP